MLSLLTPAEDKFSNYKCGEVYCETPTTYNVNCCVCSKKLPLLQFPEHFQNLHFSNEESVDIAEVKVEKEQVKADLKLLNCKDDFSINNDYQNDSDGYSSDDDIPIAFMEVELPKLKGNKLKEFLPEHVAMDFACFEETETKQENDHCDESKTSSKIQEKKPARKKTSTNRSRVKEKPQLKTLSTCNSASKDDLKTERQEIECSEQSSNINMNVDEDERLEIGSNKSSSDRDTEPEKIEIPEEFICGICKRYYKSKRGLNYHTRMMHDSANQVRKENNDASSNEKPSSYVCNICNKKFAYFGNLNVHKKRHTGVKSFKCPECGILFHTDHEMKSHYMRHTDLLPVICEICGRGFRNTGKLKAHMRRHTGERPAKCEVCGKSFFSFHDLNVHRVTHTSERPFSCEVCGATFRTKKAVRVHKKLHITERAFECNLCGKAFLKESGLTSHMQQVHLKCVP